MAGRRMSHAGRVQVKSMTYQKSPLPQGLRGAQLARVRAGQPGWSPLPGAAAAIPFACVEALAPVTTRVSVLQYVEVCCTVWPGSSSGRTRSSATVASLARLTRSTRRPLSRRFSRR